jgi:hypothetical protein
MPEFYLGEANTRRIDRLTVAIEHLADLLEKDLEPNKVPSPYKVVSPSEKDHIVEKTVTHLLEVTESKNATLKQMYKDNPIEAKAAGEYCFKNMLPTDSACHAPAFINGALWAKKYYNLCKSCRNAITLPKAYHLLGRIRDALRQRLNGRDDMEDLLITEINKFLEDSRK